MTDKQIKDMTVGDPIPLIIKFMLPLIGGQFLQQFYVVVDTIIVGQTLGVKVLASVGATDWLYWLFLWTAAGFGQGAAIPIAIKFGEKDITGVRRNICTSVILSGIIGLLMALIGVLAAEPLLLIVDTPQELMNYSKNYLMILYIGIFIVMLYNMAACILRALGDGKTPFIALIVSSLLNVILDIILVIGLNWGVEGAAVATVFSQAVATVYSLNNIVHISIMRNSISRWRPIKEDIITILKKGMPIATQMLFIALGGIFLQSINNSYGVVFVAAVTADNKIFGVLEAIAMSLGYAMTTYMGQNYGAKKFDRIRAGMHAALIISAVVSVSMAILMITFGKYILGMFISGETDMAAEALDISYRILCIMSISLMILHMLHVYRQSLAGFGNTVIPMVSGLVEGGARGAVGLMMSVFFGITGMMFVEVCAWIGSTLLVFIAYYIVFNTMKKQYISREIVETTS